MDAAKAGHLDCLKRLRQEGKFLDFYSQARQTATEAKRAQAWRAAIAACEAGNDDVLAWLFARGWPEESDDAKWYIDDVMQPIETNELRQLLSDFLLSRWGGMVRMPHWSPLEMKLFLRALRNPDTGCLLQLLISGCRSKWICPMAAREGCKSHLILAACIGCPCGIRTVLAASRQGSHSLLQTAIYYCNNTEQMLESDPFQQTLIVYDCLWSAMEAGLVDCLDTLMCWFGRQLRGENARFPEWQPWEEGGLHKLKETW